ARTHPGHAAFGIVEVPEDNGVGRAHLLTRRLDVTVGDRAAFLFGEQLAVLDPLDAHAALLHHPTRPHGHVRVEHHAPDRVVHVEIERLVLRVPEPVESPDLVWTVVLAIPRADAAVVHLLIEAVRAVRRRGHGTHRFAGRVLAVLAHHRLHQRFGMVLGIAGVGVDADPVHLTAPQHFVPADDRHVVLGLTRRHARRTARARVEIDGEAPPVRAAFAVGPERSRLGPGFSLFAQARRRHGRPDAWA